MAFLRDCYAPLHAQIGLFWLPYLYLCRLFAGTILYLSSCVSPRIPVALLLCLYIFLHLFSLSPSLFHFLRLRAGRSTKLRIRSLKIIGREAAPRSLSSCMRQFLFCRAACPGSSRSAKGLFSCHSRSPSSFCCNLTGTGSSCFCLLHRGQPPPAASHTRP